LASPEGHKILNQRNERDPKWAAIRISDTANKKEKKRADVSMRKRPETPRKRKKGTDDGR